MLPPDPDAQPGEQTLGYFALVSYIPDPPAGFLDELRLELTPGCRPRAHVTLLPPRPMNEEVNTAIRLITEESRFFSPFWIELGQVQVFEGSNVVYLEIAQGAGQLCDIYHTVNRGPLRYKENFPYHPHITLAQGLPSDKVAEAAALARKRWANYRGPCGFLVSSLSFVQHVAPSIWVDIATVPTGVEVPVGG